MRIPLLLSSSWTDNFKKSGGRFSRGINFCASSKLCGFLNLLSTVPECCSFSTKKNSARFCLVQSNSESETFLFLRIDLEVSVLSFSFGSKSEKLEVLVYFSLSLAEYVADIFLFIAEKESSRTGCNSRHKASSVITRGSTKTKFRICIRMTKFPINLTS